MTYILKTKFPNGIFGEFILQQKQADSIIILSGFPSNNIYDDLMKFLYDEGFHVFFLRYPGMYQSEGIFLEDGITEPLIEAIEEIKKGNVLNLWNNKNINFLSKEIHIMTGSFGGAVALNIAKQINIEKMILFSPVLDFSKHNKDGDEQDLNHLDTFVRRAYTHCIRMPSNNITKILAELKELSGMPKTKSNILIFHDPTDKVVSVHKITKYVESTPKTSINLDYKGHGLQYELIKPVSDKIMQFLKN